MAEEFLKFESSEFMNVLDSLLCGILIIDAEKRTIEYANLKFFNMVGANEEQVIGSVCHNYVCPAEKGKCPIMDLGQKVDNSERVLLKPSGDKIPIIKTVAPFVLNGRKYLIESFVDTTERKNVEKALQEKMNELESFNKLAVGRELKMIELKKRIVELEAKSGKKR